MSFRSWVKIRVFAVRLSTDRACFGTDRATPLTYFGTDRACFGTDRAVSFQTLRKIVLVITFDPGVRLRCSNMRCEACDANYLKM